MVGSGVEPLAHYFSDNCSTVNLKGFLSYHNHILKNFCFTKIRRIFQTIKSFFLEFGYRVSFITYKFQTLLQRYKKHFTSTTSTPFYFVPDIGNTYTYALTCNQVSTSNSSGTSFQYPFSLS